MGTDNSEFVAGHYTCTFDGADIGTTEQGFRITPVHYFEDIRVDETGDSVVDGIVRGFNCRVSWLLSTWNKAATTKLAWPYGATEGKVEIVGQTVVTAVAKQIVFTPITGIHSALKPYTFPICRPEGDHGGFEFNSRLRRMQCNFMALMNRSTGVVYSKGT